MYSELIEQWAKEQGFDTWASDHATVLRNMSRWMDKNNPEAREEAMDSLDFAAQIETALAKGAWKHTELSNRIEMYVESRRAAPKPDGQSCSVCPCRNLIAERVAVYEGLGTADLELAGAEMIIRYRMALEHTPAAPEPRPAEEPEAIAPKRDIIAEMEDPRWSERMRSEWKSASAEEPAPAPSEEEWSAIKRILNETDCTDGQFLAIKGHIDALRSQLARKDEGMREAAISLLRAWDDKFLRCSNTDVVTYMAVSIETLRAALREPDGRKGE